MEKEKPRLPEIGEFVRHHGTLVAVEATQPEPPPLPRKDYIFEVIEARCEIRHNGKAIQYLQALNDFYGLGTSVKVAIKEMKAHAIQEKIGLESDIEVVVIKVVTQYRNWSKPEENFYDKTFFDFMMTNGSQRNLPDPVETIVWSSKSKKVDEPQN